jgi:hypothetical protein
MRGTACRRLGGWRPLRECTGRRRITFRRRTGFPNLRGNIYVPYAGEIPAAARTIPEIQKVVVARLWNRALEPQVIISLNQQHSSVVSVLGDVNTPGVLALNSVGERLLALIAPPVARSSRQSRAT